MTSLRDKGAESCSGDECGASPLRAAFDGDDFAGADFPPVLNARLALPGEDVFETACAAAVSGELGAADLLWSFDGAWLRLAVILEPDIPASDAARARDVMLLAATDALAALLPPQVAIGASGDTLIINGAKAGHVRMALPDDCQEQAIPQWLATGVALHLRAPGRAEPGHDTLNTALSEEGGAHLSAAIAASAIARHFLSWLDTWIHEGIRPMVIALRAFSEDR